MPTPETLRRLPPNHPIVQLVSGTTPAFASTLDPRFSFQLQIPTGHNFNLTEPLPVLVCIHGTQRRTESFLTSLKDFADKHNIIIMAPLFPGGIEDPYDINNYKTVLYRDIRFDLILISMLEQASIIWRLRKDKFFIHGFSGGGQFVHRFLYLHPERLLGASIGAPGRFTPPDTSKSWPEGLADVPHLFKITPDFAAIARVPVQFVVGSKDVNPALLRAVKTTTAAEAEAGETRVERIEFLKHAFDELGVQSELTLVDGVGHEGTKCLPHVAKWLAPLVPAAGGR